MPQDRIIVRLASREAGVELPVQLAAAVRPSARSQRAAGDERVAPLGLVTAAVLAGAYLRFMVVARVDFPLNDGGLFYVMTRELMQAHFRLPAFTAYNAANIPFAYPPLGFYLAGLVTSVTGWPLLDVVRLLPAVLSTLTIPAFYLLSRDILRSSGSAAVATFAFAILPRTFTWFVMGGGLTRAPGFLFAILMLHRAYLMFTRGTRRDVAWTGVLGSLVVLSHAEAAWFAIYSAALFFVFVGRSRRALVQSALVAIMVLILTAPWWLTLIAQHGAGPLLAATGGGGYANFSWFPIKTFVFTDELYLPIVGALGLVGAFVAIAQGELLLPVWLGTIFLANPRNPETPAAVPLAMLVAIALCRLIAPGVSTLARAATAGDRAGIGGAVPRRGSLTATVRATAVPLMLAYLAAYTVLSSRAGVRWNSSLRALSPAERDAMAWVAANTPDSSAFLVLEPDAPWFGLDPSAEWFPALARRQSVATVQGYEWLPGRQFYNRMRRYRALNTCRTRGAACIDAWLSATRGVTHVYLHAGSCCAILAASLRASANYVPVYDGRGATIFRRVAGTR